MRVFRSGLFPALLSPMLAIGLMVGGGLVPTLHDALHHPSDQALDSGAHCEHNKHTTAFEAHHSSTGSSQCVFHQRTTTSVGPMAVVVHAPHAVHNRLVNASERVQDLRTSSGSWTRGPPVDAV